MNRRLEERRAQHQRYKEDVEERGKPFYPYAMFHDTMMSFIVVLVIVVLTCLWKFTADEGTGAEEASSSGVVGRLYDDKADPGTTSFTPRPDWYFYFLFYLLRIFKWPDSVILGTVGIPTIALLLLLALPFIDLRRERRLARRPVAVVAAILTVISMGTLTYKGATAEEVAGSEVVREWEVERDFAGNAEAVAGAEVFVQAGCMSCHTFLGSGVANEGAPDVDDMSDRGVEGFAEYIGDPSQFGNDVMPAFDQLGDDNLRRLGVFLDTAKGE